MAAETVILLHGLWMTGSEMSLLKRRFRAEGFHVIQFRYRMVTRSLDHNCDRLKKLIEAQDDTALHLVGHSLGGVLALQTLQRFPELPVTKVVCLGSPLLDSSAGRRFVRSVTGRALLGKTLPEAVFDKPLEAWEGQAKVGVIAGSRAVGLAVVIVRLPRPNDGMVTVAETCLPGINDHIEIKVGHTALVISSVVAGQCIWFLRHGVFQR
jgi:pimeloyl-ACP methyl ester carboxylesterase